MPQTETMLRRGTLAISGLLALSALALAGFGAAANPPVWFVVGFEGVVLVTAAFGVLFGLGRFPQAPAMTLALLAGSVGLCSLLGYLSTGVAGHMAGPVPLKPVVGARLALAALLAAGAAVAALGTSPGLWRRALVGVALAAIPTALAAVVLVGPGRPLVGAITSLGVTVAVAAAAVAFLTWVGLVSAGTHLVITSFERALPAPWEGGEKSDNS
ncbi:MAG: hypothetical protein ACF8R7_06550 [Phycisphaerales bacterium JB039]